MRNFYHINITLHYILDKHFSKGIFSIIVLYIELVSSLINNITVLSKCYVNFKFNK